MREGQHHYEKRGGRKFGQQNKSRFNEKVKKKKKKNPPRLLIYCAARPECWPTEESVSCDLRLQTVWSHLCNVIFLYIITIKTLRRVLERFPPGIFVDLVCSSGPKCSLFFPLSSSPLLLSLQVSATWLVSTCAVRPVQPIGSSDVEPANQHPALQSVILLCACTSCDASLEQILLKIREKFCCIIEANLCRTTRILMVPLRCWVLCGFGPIC